MQEQYFGGDAGQSDWSKELERIKIQENNFTNYVGVTGPYSGVIQGQAYIIAGES